MPATTLPRCSVSHGYHRHLGRFGVTLFFVLSGYIVASPCCCANSEQEATLTCIIAAFRRILRIWPLYFFALVAAVLLPWGGRLPFPYFMGYLLLIGNWLTAISGPPASWASLLWTISVIQQFYLVWPLVHLVLFAQGTSLCSYRHDSTRNLAPVSSWQSFTLSFYTIFPDTLTPFGFDWSTVFLCAITLKAAVPELPAPKRLLLVYAGVVLLLGSAFMGRVSEVLYWSSHGLSRGCRRMSCAVPRHVGDILRGPAAGVSWKKILQYLTCFIFSPYG